MSVFVILSCKIIFLNTDETHVVAPHKIFCGLALVSFFTVTVCYNYQTSETTIVQVRNCKQVIKPSGVWRPLSCVVQPRESGGGLVPKKQRTKDISRRL